MGSDKKQQSGGELRENIAQQITLLNGDAWSIARRYFLKKVGKHPMGIRKKDPLNIAPAVDSIKTTREWIPLRCEKSTHDKILEVTSRERINLGQELHGSIGQLLSGISLLSCALEKKLAARAVPEAREAAEIGELVRRVLMEIRQLTSMLFPVEVESVAFADAIGEFTRAVEKRFGIICRILNEEKLMLNDSLVAEHLFRLIQEAVNNSVKHGKVRTITIGFCRHGDDQAEVFIRDDGIGFSAKPFNREGMGLRIMAHRARKIGGTLTLESAEGGGALVSCVFPNGPLPPEMDAAPPSRTANTTER